MFKGEYFSIIYQYFKQGFQAFFHVFQVLRGVFHRKKMFLTFRDIFHIREVERADPQPKRQEQIFNTFNTPYCCYCFIIIIDMIYLTSDRSLGFVPLHAGGKPVLARPRPYIINCQL